MPSGWYIDDSYDRANGLTQVVSGTLTTGFTYNGAGDRVAKTVDGVTTDYVLDPAAGLTQVLVESTGGESTTYLYGHDLLAQYDSGTWAYHVNDGLGSVRQLVDAAGEVQRAQSYDPFGNLLSASGSVGSAYGFTGEQEDASAGLVFLRARYMQPSTGRFISKDPFPGYAHSPQSLNRWVYVRNNPVGLVDPSGLQGPGPVPTPGQPVAPEGTPVPPGGPQPTPTPPPGVPTPPDPADEIVRESSSNVLALIRLFEVDGFPGDDAKGRLQWILIRTASFRGSYLQFAWFPPGDAGFCDELADERFYTDERYWGEWTGEETRQMGHFLTAVALGFNPEGAYYQAHIIDFLFDKLPRAADPEAFQFEPVPPFPSDPETYALSLIVGHEMIGDQPGSGQLWAIPEQYYAATAEARTLFLKAVEADKDRRYWERDNLLQPILGFSEDAIHDPRRIGNSMQDLRLSVKGWRFGQEIRNRDIGTRQQAANWLRREIYDPFRTR